MKRLPLAECRDCGQPIRFVRLDTGNPLPINPGVNLAGNVVAYNAGGHLEGWVISKDKPAVKNARRYTPHAATCSARKPEPSRVVRDPDPVLF